MMLYQKQCEVYNYFSTSYFISLISGKKIITKPSKTRRSQGGRIWQDMSHWDTWKVGLEQHMTRRWESKCKTNKLAVGVSISVCAVWCWQPGQACVESVYLSLNLHDFQKKKEEINALANKRGRDGGRMRSDESLKIKMQNSNSGSAQMGDNSAVVPLLPKHLHRKSPPSDLGIIGGLWSPSAETPSFLSALPSRLVADLPRRSTVQAWIHVWIT